jgi:hypothetical protein
MHVILGAGGAVGTELVRESREMLYQYEFDYVFDSGKFTGAFGVQPTTYAEGVDLAAEAYWRK